jgi:hypothetical protein
MQVDLKKESKNDAFTLVRFENDKFISYEVDSNKFSSYKTQHLDSIYADKEADWNNYNYW